MAFSPSADRRDNRLARPDPSATAGAARTALRRHGIHAVRCRPAVDAHAVVASVLAASLRAPLARSTAPCLAEAPHHAEASAHSASLRASTSAITVVARSGYRVSGTLGVERGRKGGNGSATSTELWVLVLELAGRDRCRAGGVFWFLQSARLEPALRAVPCWRGATTQTSSWATALSAARRYAGNSEAPRRAPPGR